MSQIRSYFFSIVQLIVLGYFTLCRICSNSGHITDKILKLITVLALLKMPGGSIFIDNILVKDKSWIYRIPKNTSHAKQIMLQDAIQEHIHGLKHL